MSSATELGSRSHGEASLFQRNDSPTRNIRKEQVIITRLSIEYSNLNSTLYIVEKHPWFM